MRPEPVPISQGPSPKQPFFARATGRRFQARQHAGATVIDLYDEIGAWGVSAREFQARLRDAEGDVTLRINSPGGDVFDGLAIFNAAVAHPGKVRVEIVGVAASIASIIAMAGDEIAIAENAFIMVHRAWGVTVGNEADHAEAVGLLQAVDRSMAGTYAARTGQNATAVRSMMNAETWMSAEAAIEAGFATETLAPADIRARFDLSVFSRAPAALAAPEPGELTIRDVEAALRAAGASRSQARALAARGHQGVSEEQRDAAELADLARHIASISL